MTTRQDGGLKSPMDPSICTTVSSLISLGGGGYGQMDNSNKEKKQPMFAVMLQNTGVASGGSSKIVDLMNQLGSGIKHDDLAVEEMQPLTPALRYSSNLHMRFLMDCEYDSLVQPFRTWEEKVVAVLHVVRCRELTVYDPKIRFWGPTRFCEFNIAMFDHNKESEVVHGPLFRKVHPSQYYRLEHFGNIISIKVAKSDALYPINIYGTILVTGKGSE
ncbi:hypothetical protein BS78_02G172000 [Paspalum vaginatum]|nr:hypothetical protein BS78_02G172000 [Paspalum vaginatum]